MSAKQQEDGTWLAKCPICTYKAKSEVKGEAENELRNHINTKHQEGAQKKVRPGKRPKPAKEMPPQLPAEVKEQH